MNEVALTLVESIVPVFVCVLMPALIVWLCIRPRINETNKRAQVLLSALERKDDIDLTTLVGLLNSQRKSPKEKQQMRLTRGCICCCVAIALFIYIAVIQNMEGIDVDIDDVSAFLLTGFVLAAVGIAYIIVYFLCKKPQLNGNND